MDIEIIPIAIQLNHYNQNIANLIDHLLTLDQEMFGADKTNEQMGAA